MELWYFLPEAGERQVQFAVGFKIQGKTGHVVVDAEDALIAALKVKMRRPEAPDRLCPPAKQTRRHPSPYAPTQQREPLVRTGRPLGAM
jgi:hypothetical protein